jgi:hypothetical protein
MSQHQLPAHETQASQPEPRFVASVPASPTVELRFLRFDLINYVERQKAYLDSLGVPHHSTPKRWFQHLESCDCARCVGWTKLWHQTRARQMRYNIAKRKLTETGVG